MTDNDEFKTKMVNGATGLVVGALAIGMVAILLALVWWVIAAILGL